jgi:menaquinone-specific isochorismate synthase
LLSRERIALGLNGGHSGGLPGRAHWLLAGQVSRSLSEAGGVPDGAARVVRLAVPVGRLEPLRWLREQPLLPRLYWSGRDGGSRVAAVGVADLQAGDVSDDVGSLQKRLAPLLSSDDGEVRYYGGLRFDPSRETGAEWAPFGAYRFVLPRFELHATDGEATLVCNLVLPRDARRHAEILDRVERLSFPRETADHALPEPVSRRDHPDREGWSRNVERALAVFSEGRLDKVVLARRTELDFSREIDPALLAESLEEATPGCFHFYVEPEVGVAFVCASPERLFRRDGRSIESEAVAGTRPRGASAADDDELRDDLLSSQKDKAEHEYVRAGIREALGPICDELEVESGVSEMKLASRRHMLSRVRGVLREGVADAEVLRALHPTPAVGGYPKEGALEEIRSAEPFDRGWYAGPVGWIGADAAEFAVGIRSGLVRGNRLALFSGNGIVEGSVPEAEWAEIEQKISDFTGMFGFDPARRAGR